VNAGLGQLGRTPWPGSPTQRPSAERLLMVRPEPPTKRSTSRNLPQKPSEGWCRVIDPALPTRPGPSPSPPSSGPKRRPAGSRSLDADWWPRSCRSQPSRTGGARPGPALSHLTTLASTLHGQPLHPPDPPTPPCAPLPALTTTVPYLDLALRAPTWAPPRSSNQPQPAATPVWNTTVSRARTGFQARECPDKAAAAAKIYPRVPRPGFLACASSATSTGESLGSALARIGLVSQDLQ